VNWPSQLLSISFSSASLAAEITVNCQTLPRQARWLVPKMVKNGFKSSLVYWSLIWACLTDNPSRVERCQIRRIHQILKEVGFSHEQLRLQLTHLESQGTQEDPK
jgi:hypothetical protein